MLGYHRQASDSRKIPSVVKVSNMFRVAVVFPIRSEISGVELAKLDGYALSIVNNMTIHFCKENVFLSDIPVVKGACVITTDSLGVSMTNHNCEGWKPVYENQVIPALFAAQTW